jgi:hypothetical protein
MNSPNIHNVTKIERLSNGMVKVYNKTSLVAIFSSLKSINIYRENGKPIALMFCQDCIDPFGFTVYNLIEIIGSTTTQTYDEIDPTTSNDSYQERIFNVLNFLVDECLTAFSPQPTFVGGVVAEYPNFASFPVTGQSGVIYIDMSGPTAYVWDGAAYQSLSGAGGFVPYTGATADVDLGTYNLKADALEVSQTPVDTAGVGKMVWNDTDGTIEFKLKGGNVTLQTGQEEVVRVVNKTGGNLLEANYECVRIRTQAEGGAAGQRLAVKLAQANTKANHTGILGLVTETINNNQEGFITTFGEVKEINTTGSLQGETWLDGDALWLSDTTAGGLTNIEPTTHPVQIGYVVYAHGVHGKIFVSVSQGADELNELHDVTITSPVTNDILQYNSSGIWVNNNPPLLNFITVSDGTGVTGTTVSTLTNSILIPANSVSTGDMIYIKTRVRKTGTLGTLVVRMYVNTTATIGGSLIATSGANANTTLYFQYARTLAVKTSTNTESMAGNANINADDNIGLTVAVSTSNIDWTVDQYLIVAVQNGNIGDTTRGSFIHVQVHKS